MVRARTSPRHESIASAGTLARAAKARATWLSRSSPSPGRIGSGSRPDLRYLGFPPTSPTAPWPPGRHRRCTGQCPTADGPSQGQEESTGRLEGPIGRLGRRLGGGDPGRWYVPDLLAPRQPTTRLRCPWAERPAETGACGHRTRGRDSGYHPAIVRSPHSPYGSPAARAVGCPSSRPLPPPARSRVSRPGATKRQTRGDPGTQSHGTRAFRHESAGLPKGRAERAAVGPRRRSTTR
jgi:hypothetical protein